MTGGISLSLNSALARLNAIESNFQALNNVALEADIKQTQQVQNKQNSDFKTILDGKVNTVQKNIETPEVEEISELEQVPEIEQILDVEQAPETQNSELPKIEYTEG